MKKVIFDVDGVLLSEKRYFDVSALVVWEWYYSPRYMHLKPERITADLDDETIAAYVATGEPLDKAGGYAVQGRAAAFIEAVRGSFSGVVGLPLCMLAQLAKRAGVDLYDSHGAGSARG